MYASHFSKPSTLDSNDDSLRAQPHSVISAVCSCLFSFWWRLTKWYPRTFLLEQACMGAPISCRHSSWKSKAFVVRGRSCTASPKMKKYVRRGGFLPLVNYKLPWWRFKNAWHPKHYRRGKPFLKRMHEEWNVGIGVGIGRRYVILLD